MNGHDLRIAMATRTTDIVNHPPHYKGSNGIEAIDVIEGFDLDFRLGNAVKYILRCGRKGDLPAVIDRHRATIEDLQKARWYIERSIADYEGRIEFWRELDADTARHNRRHQRRRKL